MTNDAVDEAGKLIEEELEIKLANPMSEELKNEIRSKFLILKKAWQKQSGGNTRQVFRSEIEKQMYRISLNNSDIEQDSLLNKYQATQDLYEIERRKKHKLKESMRGLNAELELLKRKLEETENELHVAKSKREEIKAIRTETGLKISFRTEFNKDVNEVPRNSNPNTIRGMFESGAVVPSRTKDIDLSTKTMLVAQKYKERDIKKLKDDDYPALSRVVKYVRRKSYYLVSRRQRNRLNKQIKDSITESTQFLKNMGLCLSYVEINPIEMDECDFKLKIKPPEEFLDVNKPNVNNLLFYKDKHSISDRAYCDLKTRCFLDIPSVFSLKKRRGELDSLFELQNNQMGVYITLKDKLKFRLELFFGRKYNQVDINKVENFQDHIIHLKLGADGTNIGRNLKLLNFTFTILNEGAKAKTATGNYTLGIFEIENENHSSVTKCFKELIDEMEQLKEIEIGERTLKIVYYLAGDWKMLAHSLGLLSANSKYPCVWCKCCKEEFYNMSNEWSICDSNFGARSYDELVAVVNHPDSKKIVKYGYEKPPVFRNVIPISRYMIDMLHLFLRISDTLFNLLVKDCSLADNFDMGAISKFDISIYKHLNSLQHFLNEKCNVKFTFLWLAETKRLTWRDLVGPEKIKLFENFNLAEIIPDHENFESVKKIWIDFYEIIQQVKQVNIESEELKQRTREWLRLFLSVYSKTTVTPYMHAFVSHLHEFVFLYKDINAFNCQGLEKLNDLSTGQYFKGTNKQETALHQMLKKRNRMEYLSSLINDE
jgi:hypothetical protein